jgi:hypothetical protein
MKTPEERWKEFSGVDGDCSYAQQVRPSFIRQIREAEKDARKDALISAELEKDDAVNEAKDEARKAENEACAKIAELSFSYCVADQIRARVAPPKPKSPFGCECWKFNGKWIGSPDGKWQHCVGVKVWVVDPEDKHCRYCGAKRTTP